MLRLDAAGRLEGQVVKVDGGRRHADTPGEVGYDRAKSVPEEVTMWQMIVGALLVAMGLVVGVALSTNVDAAADAKWWEILTAVGTFGAVVVALVFGMIPLYQQARRDRYRAQVLRWLVLPWFGSVFAGCQIVEAVMGKLLEVPVGEKADGMTVFELSAALPMLDVRRLLQHSGELHVLNSESKDVAELIAAADRLHDLLNRMDLSLPLQSERSVFGSTQRQAKELAARVDLLISRHSTS